MLEKYLTNVMADGSKREYWGGKEKKKVGESEKLVIWDASGGILGQVHTATAAQHDGKEHYQHLPPNLIVTIRTRLHFLSIMTDESLK